MDADLSKIQQLITRPSESLAIELKRWIDPDKPKDEAKIARAAIALRNFNGGYLIIGFDNDTLEPDIGNAPSDVQATFHVDKIQGIVSRYASEPFEIVLEFPERDGQAYPVMIIPSGVRTPVAAKVDLPNPNPDGKFLIKRDDVYVRSLRSNNTPSTTKAGWKDWPQIMEICFDNREADIGRFLRRHLGGVTPDVVKELASALVTGIEPEPAIEEILKNYLQEGRERFHQVVQKRQVKLPEHGAWEAALYILGEVPKHSANQIFLNLLDSSNPNYTGWPIWLDSRRFTQSYQPYIHEEVWEALIIRLDGNWGDGIDFLRLDPTGKFYLYRALEDDFSHSQRVPESLTKFDFSLPIIRTAEVIAVGIAFAIAMGCETETATLSFAFRWSGLLNRELSSWARPERALFPGRVAYRNDLITEISVPLNTPLSALGDYVYQVVEPLFEVFDGFTLGRTIVEDLTRELIERRS